MQVQALCAIWNLYCWYNRWCSLARAEFEI